jgi:hypothetical protein
MTLRFTVAGAPLAVKRIRISPMNQHADIHYKSPLYYDKLNKEGNWKSGQEIRTLNKIKIKRYQTRIMKNK